MYRAHGQSQPRGQMESLNVRVLYTCRSEVGASCAAGRFEELKIRVQVALHVKVRRKKDGHKGLWRSPGHAVVKLAFELSHI